MTARALAGVCVRTMPSIRPLLVAGTLLASLAACRDTAGPAGRFLVDITDIAVPAVVAPSDTARISFKYEASCGQREIALRFNPGRLEVRAYGFDAPPGLVCPGWLYYAERTVLLPPAERADEHLVVFVQPSGADSVRSILRAPTSADAP